MTPEIALRIEDWSQARARSYDLLQSLASQDPALLRETLPFPQSQSLVYQFWCMIGAQESYAAMIEAGGWQGFRSSLDAHDPALEAGTIERAMRRADAALHLAVERRLSVVEDAAGAVADTLHTLVSHELQHQGQLINFIFCFGIPIPESWEQQWALRHGE